MFSNSCRFKMIHNCLIELKGTLPVPLLALVGLQVPLGPKRWELVHYQDEVCGINQTVLVINGHTVSPFSPGVPQSPLSPYKTSHGLESWLRSVDMSANEAVRHPPYCPCNLVDPVKNETVLKSGFYLMRRMLPVLPRRGNSVYLWTITSRPAIQARLPLIDRNRFTMSCMKSGTWTVFCVVWCDLLLLL